MNKNGIHTEFHENGKKQSEGNFKDGKLDGLYTEWYENGQKKSERNFKDGDFISKKCWDNDGIEKECE